MRRLGLRSGTTISAAATQELVAGLLRDGAGVKVEVSGHSMSPFIRGGDVVTLRPLNERPPRRGDVLAVATRRGLIVHRLIAQGSGTFRTRGDCAGAEDPPSSAQQVVGVVERVERRGRRVRFGLGLERAMLALIVRSGAGRRLARLFSRFPGRRAAGGVGRFRTPSG